MYKIIIDNIIYRAQRIGGISCVFYELTKRLLKDNRFSVSFLERDDASGNFYRKLLNIPSNLIVKIRFSCYLIDRFINPQIHLNEKYIFHSSYFRTSRDKTAINITTVHDFVYERVNLQGFVGKIHIWQQKKAVKNSDYVICVSENTRKDFLHYYNWFDPKKVFVVYNGVSNDYFPIESIEDNSLPYAHNSYCMFVGGRMPYKQFKLVIESISKTDFNLVIVGSQLSDKEKKYIFSYLPQDRFITLIHVPNVRLNELYNGAFCLLYPSSYEGFGIPCLEAQKAGCPVIAYNGSSIPEVVKEKRLLIDDLSTTEVVNRMNLLKDNDYRAKVVKEGIEFSNTFSWDRCYKETSEVYLKAFK